MRENINIQKNMAGLDCEGIFDPVVDTQASTYFVEHYEEITGQAYKMNGVDPSKVEDLVNDVLVSIMESEQRGDGYECTADREWISVKQFVYGRLKNYSKNKRYHREGSDSRVFRSKETGKEEYFDIAFASFSGTDTEDMDASQMAYANAASYDDGIESIEDSESLRSNIELCLDFSEVIGFDFMNLFKNIEMFCRDFDAGIFDGLRKSLNLHDELRDALQDVLLASNKNRNAFDVVLNNVCASLATV